MLKLHKNMNNQEIARLLRAVSAAYEINKENAFRIRAYDNAADSVEHSSREVKDLWEEGKLDQLPGVGTNIASHLEELFKKGKVSHFTQVFKKLPLAVFEFIEIPGIGPKTAYKLSMALRIKDARKAVIKLEKAAKEGKIRVIEGFGEESEKKIIKSIEEFKRREDRMLLPEATQIAQEIVEYMLKEKAVIRIDPLGSLRRRSPSVGDIDLAVSTKNPKKVITHFTRYKRAEKTLAAGDKVARIILRSGRQVDLKIQEPEGYGALLQHFTGSKNHNIHLRELALKKGYSLSEHGIKIKNKIKKFTNEKDFYNALDLEWIPPELREDKGEIDAAKQNKIPILVDNKDIKGDLHTHTNYPWNSSHDSGKNSAVEIVNKALELGYEYVGVGDHNPSFSNLSEDTIISLVKKRSDHIEQIKTASEKAVKHRVIRVLNTLEVDILKDGNLAIPDAALDQLDFAVVSIHSSMRMPKTTMTDRIIKALSHPKAKILGHPTGRLITRREGYEIDWEKLFKFLKSEKKILEINAWPTRLDLPDSLVRAAIKEGINLVINTDAHSTGHMDLMRYGIDVARRGWAKKKDILNAQSFNVIKRKLLDS